MENKNSLMEKDRKLRDWFLKTLSWWDVRIYVLKGIYI